MCQSNTHAHTMCLCLQGHACCYSWTWSSECCDLSFSVIIPVKTKGAEKTCSSRRRQCSTADKNIGQMPWKQSCPAVSTSVCVCSSVCVCVVLSIFHLDQWGNVKTWAEKIEQSWPKPDPGMDFKNVLNYCHPLFKSNILYWGGEQDVHLFD